MLDGFQSIIARHVLFKIRGLRWLYARKITPSAVIAETAFRRGIETYLECSQRCKFDACDVDAVALGLHDVAIYAWHSVASTV
jgi:hypothetical protein